MNLTTFYLLLGAWTFLALILAPVQLRIAAPYGRHVNSSWGPAIDNRLGWILMEIVSPVALMYWMWRGSPAATPALYVLAGLWVLHYVNRSVVFPLRLRTRGKRIPVAIVLSAAVFNLFNGFFNGYWWAYLAGPYPDDWLRDPRFILGAVLFVAGAFVNHRSDALLIALRRPGETGYRIPQGWLFRWVSCPNHLGEIVQWFGFALMAWNLPALSFAVWTAANLIPRAVAHHRWYQAQFADYPAERRAVVPGVW